MNKRILLRIPAAAGYAVPYAFLCLYGDVTFGSMLLYLLALPTVCLLAYCSRRRLFFGCMGCLCSFGASFACMAHFRSERWLWYFKPFSDTQLLVLLSLFMLAIHLLASLLHRRMRFPTKR
ncbi:MAG: hypothetical protein IJD60_13020 [Clostridia bacterium]|nr:hypothetical protein [Clostridia bacterium]